MDQKDLKKLFSLPVIVAALGYFVDIYDLLLFSIVRRPSLIAIGVPEDRLLIEGEFLLRSQMWGLLVGGLIWGIIADKRGRLSVLFGSILLYSLANIANGFVTSIEQYAWLRFIAGVGLAGELGAGVTLVAESLPPKIRGYGPTIIATFGLLGAVAANFVVKLTGDDWQTAYFIGGGLGLLLLVARASVLESSIFLKVKEKAVDRGNVLLFISSWKRITRLLGCIFIALPTWYAIGILITFSPEFAKALDITGVVVAGDAVMFCYLGLAAGDLASGVLSQMLQTRKKVVAGFILFTTAAVLLYLFIPVRTTAFFYVNCFVLGFGIGYWALFITIAAEQFGTNLRGTVATSVPNFIRGTVIPLTIFFGFLRETLGAHYTPLVGAVEANKLSLVYGALIVGLCTIVIAFIALSAIDETFGRDLNFEEADHK